VNKLATDDAIFSRHQYVAKTCHNSEFAADDAILIRSQQVAKRQLKVLGIHKTKLHHATYSRKSIQSKTLHLYALNKLKTIASKFEILTNQTKDVVTNYVKKCYKRNDYSIVWTESVLKFSKADTVSV
jgi:hypothetical protein